MNEIQFRDRVQSAIQEMERDCKYTPSQFMEMIREYNTLNACKMLINAPGISEGFMRLFDAKRLDLTVEAIALEPECRELFSETELQRARKRLRQYEYRPKENLVETSPNEDGGDKEWSKTEIKETVLAYLRMLSLQQAKMPYVKSEIRKELLDGPLRNRSNGSVEFRMANISSVLEDLGFEIVKGYLPRKNVGPKQTDTIREILSEVGYFNHSDLEPTEDLELYENRAKKLIKNISEAKPNGIESPEKSIQQVTVFKRNPVVRAWILKWAKGKCEKCDSPSPFLKEDGEPYLEVHHLITLSNAGADKVENTVALCPNCHRQLHYGVDKESLIRKLRNKIERLRL